MRAGVLQDCMGSHKARRDSVDCCCRTIAVDLLWEQEALRDLRQHLGHLAIGHSELVQLLLSGSSDLHGLVRAERNWGC